MWYTPPMRYSHIPPRIGRTVAEAIDDLEDIPTTPGDMQWVDCICKGVAIPVELECSACQGYGQVLIIVSRKAPKT